MTTFEVYLVQSKSNYRSNSMIPRVSFWIKDFKNVSNYFYRLLLHQNNCDAIWCNLKSLLLKSTKVTSV